MSRYSLNLNDVKKALAKKSYKHYVEYVHEGLYQHHRHTLFICSKIDEAIAKKERMVSGEIPTENQYLMFNLPPRHGKSMTLTETLPSYYLGRFPLHRVIEISYNDTFAKKFGKKNRLKVSQYGKELFDIELSKESTAVDDWYLNNDVGGMISRGALAGITGQGADLMLIDDPIKNREEANSETTREKLWDEWIDSFSTRLHPGAIVVIILTRWHEDDLQGRLLNEEYAKPLPWQVYNIPLEAEENDLLGRNIGEPIWPERYGHSFIEERKKYPSSFNSLYQGRPTAQEGNMLKRDWWQYYDVLPIDIPQKILSVDATFKDGDDNDYVAIQVWGKSGPNAYLIDQVKAKMNFPTTLQAIRNILAKHKDVGVKLVEDKANGSAIIQTLQMEIPGFVGVNPSGGKVARVNAVSPFIESGNVFLPRNAEWIHDFVEESASFPNGKHDDSVDAMSQALNRFYYWNANVKQEEPFKPYEQVFHDHVNKIMKKKKKVKAI